MIIVPLGASRKMIISLNSSSTFFFFVVLFQRAGLPAGWVTDRVFNFGSVRYVCVCVFSVIKRRDSRSRRMVYDILCRAPEPVFKFEAVLLYP